MTSDTLPPGAAAPTTVPGFSGLAFLTQDELARRWRLSTKTLERWRWQRVGPSFTKIGARVVYPVGAVEAYERRQLRQIEQDHILGRWG